jgi:flagellar basal body-associated protein FliL
MNSNEKRWIILLVAVVIIAVVFFIVITNISFNNTLSTIFIIFSFYPNHDYTPNDKKKSYANDFFSKVQFFHFDFQVLESETTLPQ